MSEHRCSHQTILIKLHLSYSIFRYAWCKASGTWLQPWPAIRSPEDWTLQCCAGTDTEIGCNSPTQSTDQVEPATEHCISLALISPGRDQSIEHGIESTQLPRTQMNQLMEQHKQWQVQLRVAGQCHEDQVALQGTCRSAQSSEPEWAIK